MTPQNYPPPGTRVPSPENGKEENYPPPIATVLIPDRQQGSSSAPTTTTNDGMSTTTKIIIAVSCSVGGIILLAIVVVLCCHCGQKRKVKHSGGNTNDLERGRGSSSVPRRSSNKPKSQKRIYQMNSFDPYLGDNGTPEVVPLEHANVQVSPRPAGSKKSTLATSDILKNGPVWITQENHSEVLSNTVGPMAAAATASSWASRQDTRKKKSRQPYSETVLPSRQVSKTNNTDIETTNYRTEGAIMQNDSKSSMATTYDIEFSSMELDLPVGQGSFGTIYRAIWNETPVAVKFLTSAKDKESFDLYNTGERGLVSALESESEILSSLRHPNIVQFIGVCSQPPCIISEFVERGSLSDLIRGTRDPQELSWGMLLKMLTDAATGMLYLHARSSPIIHCDLKSNNILVDSFYRTKICDFNLSRLLEQSTGSLASVQNPRWLAPEVLDGEGYSKESDVYSFGIVMWEVLTRQIPWYGVDTGDIVSLVRDGARPQVPNFWDVQDGRGNELIVFEEYVELMTTCWSQNPYDRPPFGEIIKILKDMTLLSGQHVVSDLGARNHPPEEHDGALLTNESTRAMTDSMPYKHV